MYKIEISGNSYEFKFTTRAIAELEKSLGYSILSSKFVSDNSVDRRVRLVWAGLLHTNGGLTLEQVFSFLDESGEFLLSASDQAMAAFNHYWGFDKQAGKETNDTEEKKTEM
jgi:hypothetical protein